jgi:arabinan endo-1,5-alpha-L-arabinosidase
MRDPFVLVVPQDARYFLFGTTDEDCWKGPGAGFNAYSSADLENWEGPIPAFRPPKDFWGQKNFWAPEAHAYRGSYYLFASFFAAGRRRGTQILKAQRPEGPYLEHSDGPVTPEDWECLDGSFFMDEEGKPWMVFCHEWVQVKDGQVCAIPLSEDLRERIGDPVTLFRASEAPWTRQITRLDGSTDPDWRVTDGPFLFRASDGGLLLLWSSFSDSGYAIGAARSAKGRLAGPWEQSREPLMDKDSGHGMVFRSLAGELLLTLHAPNKTPLERPIFVPIEEWKGWLRLRNRTAR